MNPSEKVEEGWINARLIIEAQGKPEKYILENLEAIKTKLSQTKDVEVYDVKSESPHKSEGELVSALMDLGVLTKDAETLTSLVLTYGPSAVLIIEPKEIKLDFRQLQNMLNDVAGLLHAISQKNLQLSVQNYLVAKKVATKK